MIRGGRNNGFALSQYARVIQLAQVDMKFPRMGGIDGVSLHKFGRHLLLLQGHLRVGIFKVLARVPLGICALRVIIGAFRISSPAGDCATGAPRGPECRG